MYLSGIANGTANGSLDLDGTPADGKTEALLD
jgi:hypothetical protein